MRRLLTSQGLSVLLGEPCCWRLLIRGGPGRHLAKITSCTGCDDHRFRERRPFSSSRPMTPSRRATPIDLCLRIAGGYQEGPRAAAARREVGQGHPENRIASVTNGTVDIECGSTTKTLVAWRKVDFTVLTFLDGGTLLTLTRPMSTDSRICRQAGGRHPGTTTEGRRAQHGQEARAPERHAPRRQGPLGRGWRRSTTQVDAYEPRTDRCSRPRRPARNPAKLYLIEDFISL